MPIEILPDSRPICRHLVPGNSIFFDLLQSCPRSPGFCIISSMACFDPDPEENPACRYCAAFLAPDTSSEDGDFNKPILESPNFVVMPTLGFFIPGWLLIVPRRHYPCLGAMDKQLYAEFLHLKSRAEALLHSMYGRLIEFEHGPCSPGVAGACVDHAHLHMVPTSVDLEPDLSSRFVGRTIQGLTELSVAYDHAHSYLFYKNSGEAAKMYDVELLPSQYMRMLLARRLEVLDRYDWRIYSGRQELKSFLQLLGKSDLERPKGELFAQR